MVTAEEVEKELRNKFCPMFGFSSSDLIIKKERKEIVLMHGLLSVGQNVFYQTFLQKSFWLKNKRKVEKLKKKAQNFFLETKGGSGFLDWRSDWHDLVYKALKAITKEQAEALFLYPKYADENRLKEIMPAFASYIPQFIPMLKFLGFVKVIYPEWEKTIDECRETCLTHKKYQGGKLLPWYWTGEIDKYDHAAIIHESIHNILHNSGTDKAFEHNAWNEGIDVFFHRRSRLYLGYYKLRLRDRLPFFARNDIISYWMASQIFWEELKDVSNSQLKNKLSTPIDPKVQKITQRIKEIWPNSSDFHSAD